MAEDILVVNAGSSSIKFSVFGVEGGRLDLALHGQAEGLYTSSPRFRATDARGNRVDEKPWREGAEIGHQAAIKYLAELLPRRRGKHRLAAVGHRVVHGGRDFTQPVLALYRIGRELGSLAAAMHGIDALVFTTGMGEHSAAIPERVCREAAWLGVKIDPAANEAGEVRISTADSRVSVWAIPTNEELMIARHTLNLIGTASP